MRTTAVFPKQLFPAALCGLLLFCAMMSLQAAQGALVLDDSLHGSTTGTRSGGVFLAGLPLA